jgi:hypothetical protein
MDDNSICQKQYNQRGKVLKESSTVQKDLVGAMASMERIINDLKSQNYIEQLAPINELPKVLGKRGKKVEEVKKEPKKGKQKRKQRKKSLTRQVSRRPKSQTQAQSK